MRGRWWLVRDGAGGDGPNPSSAHVPPRGDECFGGRAVTDGDTEPGVIQAGESVAATQGDGGVYSSLEDLAKWDAALREHKLFSAADMQAALTPVRVPDHSVRGPAGEPEEYGFGWYLSP